MNREEEHQFLITASVKESFEELDSKMKSYAELHGDKLSYDDARKYLFSLYWGLIQTMHKYNKIYGIKELIYN